MTYFHHSICKEPWLQRSKAKQALYISIVYEMYIKRIENRKAPDEDTLTNTALKNLPTIALLHLSKKDLNSSVQFIELLHFSLYCQKYINASSLANYAMLLTLRSVQSSSLSRDHHSTTAQLINLTDQLEINANNKKRKTAIFLDVEYAFDYVWHHGFPLHKLPILSTSIHYLKIKISFIINRTFRVENDKQLTSPRWCPTRLLPFTATLSSIYL